MEEVKKISSANQLIAVPVVRSVETEPVGWRDLSLIYHLTP